MSTFKLCIVMIMFWFFSRRIEFNVEDKQIGYCSSSMMVILSKPDYLFIYYLLQSMVTKEKPKDEL